jgi:hypothetical protein
MFAAEKGADSELVLEELLPTCAEVGLAGGFDDNAKSNEGLVVKPKYRPGEIVAPSDFAAFRLMTNSNLVGIATRRSSERAPLIMRPA